MLAFFSDVIKDAATNLVASGVTTVAAAGNSDNDATYWAPAGAPSVITVAASTIADEKAAFSNYGAVVDIWAPGA